MKHPKRATLNIFKLFKKKIMVIRCYHGDKEMLISYVNPMRIYSTPMGDIVGIDRIEVSFEYRTDVPA